MWRKRSGVDFGLCVKIFFNSVLLRPSKKDDVPYLRVLIEEHHTLFKGLYPAASIIPKMYYVIHIPDDIPGDYEFIISFPFVSCSVVSVNFACSPSNYNVN